MKIKIEKAYKADWEHVCEAEMIKLAIAKTNNLQTAYPKVKEIIHSTWECGKGDNHIWIANSHGERVILITETAKPIKTTKKRIAFRMNDTLTVFTLGKTANAKIALPTEKIVQTYHYSREQFEIAQNKTSMKEFFGADAKVCMDCPFAVSNGAKLTACYTHKMNQYSGFLSSLRSIGSLTEWNDIPMLNDDIIADIIAMCENRYVRFGTYGEPSLLPIAIVESICNVASVWTGYTHQWRKLPEYAPYFMASTHDVDQEYIANLIGYRSFVASKTIYESMISCPASAEQNYRSHCSKCGLCSGTNGKGKKSVVILEH